MLLPKLCPICNSTLLNEFHHDKLIKGDFYINKKCTTRLGHSLYINAREDTNTIQIISLCFDDYRVYFDFQFKKITLTQSFKNTFDMPWFEPDFYKFKELKRKIKTYILFK